MYFIINVTKKGYMGLWIICLKKSLFKIYSKMDSGPGRVVAYLSMYIVKKVKRLT